MGAPRVPGPQPRAFLAPGEGCDRNFLCRAGPTEQQVDSDRSAPSGQDSETGAVLPVMKVHALVGSDLI